MIIVDMSQIMFANIMMQLKTKKDKNETQVLEEGMFRHMALNTLRYIREKFSKEYGELVIANDVHANNWRKAIFPYYKASRKKTREASEYDWALINAIMDKIKAELKEYFPYRVLSVDGAEADDIIAVLTKKFHSQEKILIISSDKDFGQLQKYDNVYQYDNIRSKWIVIEDPEAMLKSHIIKGDVSDGIPNFLTQNNIFLISGLRQKTITTKNLEKWVNLEPEVFCDDLTIKYYRRNEMLIDFSKIPEKIEASILIEYENESGKNRDKLFEYFIKNRLKNLITDINQF